MLISIPAVKCYPCKLLALKRMLTKYTFEHSIRIPGPEGIAFLGILLV